MSKNNRKENSATVVLKTSSFRIVLKSMLICMIIGAIIGAAFMVVANHNLLKEDQTVGYVAEPVSMPLANATEGEAGANDTIDLTGIEFEDKSVAYTGAAQALTLSAEDEAALVAAGVEVKYFNNQYTDVGTYTATVVLTKGANVEVLTANLTINPIKITGITFEGEEFIYDGSAKEIKIKGEVPNGVTVEYYNNTNDKLGTHTATVVLYGKNYVTLVLEADFTIVESDVLKTLVGFNGSEFSYNEKSHKIEITGKLPEGVTVAYENNDQTNVGKYEVTATVSGYGYTTYVTKATIKIVSGDLIAVRGLKMEPVEYGFDDGKEHTIKFTGELPEGVVATYSEYDATNAGTYTVKVSFHDAEGRFVDCELSATITVIPKDISDYVSFTNLEYTYDPNAVRKIEVTILQALPTGMNKIEYFYNGECISENGDLTKTFANAGEYEIKVRISGDNNYAPIEKTAKIIIDKYDVKKFIDIDRNQTFTSSGNKCYLPEFEFDNMPSEVRKSDVKFYVVDENGEEVLLTKGYSAPGEYDIIVRIETENYTYENDVTIRVKYNLLIVLIFMLMAAPVGILIGILAAIIGSHKDKLSQNRFEKPSTAIKQVRGNLTAESRARSEEKRTLGRLYLTETTLEFYGDDFKHTENNFLISMYDVRNVDAISESKIVVYANGKTNEFTVPKGTAGAWAAMIVDAANACTND